MTETPPQNRRIVSARHLAEGPGWEMSEVEYGLIIAYNAFARWMVKCMSASGGGEMTPLDILVLHHVNHRGRGKRLADICFLLNLEDSHTVNYALRKLLKADMLISEKRGKEVFYSTSETGAALCESYRKIRQTCLLDASGNMDLGGEEMREIAARLRALSGQYDQASRAAVSL